MCGGQECNCAGDPMPKFGFVNDKNESVVNMQLNVTNRANSYFTIILFIYFILFLFLFI